MTDQAEDRQRVPRRRMKFALASLALLAVSGTIALLLAELVVRIAAPQQLIVIRPDIWQSADTIGWRLRSNTSGKINTGERTVTVATDHEGFRIGEAGRREAETTVLLLGDSFAEAIQVEHEQSFAHLVERDLERSLGSPVAVRNAGAGGYGPDQYLLRARQLIPSHDFDLVLVAIFTGNDAIRNPLDYHPPRAETVRRRLRFPRSLSPRELVDAWAAPVNDALEVRSHLFTLFKNQLAGLRMKLGMTADYFPGEFLTRQADSDRWSITAGLAKQIDDLAREHGARALFVLVPDRLQIHEDDLHRYATGFGIDSSMIDLEQPSRLLSKEFAALGLEVIEPLARFRAAAAEGPRLYGTVDPHLSPAGHEVLASVIVPEALRVLSAPATRSAPAKR